MTFTCKINNPEIISVVPLVTAYANGEVQQGTYSGDELVVQGVPATFNMRLECRFEYFNNVGVSTVSKSDGSDFYVIGL